LSVSLELTEAKEAGSFLEWVGFVDKDSDEKEYELTVRLTATRKDQSIFYIYKSGARQRRNSAGGRSTRNYSLKGLLYF